jgi:hypothetical protein
MRMSQGMRGPQTAIEPLAATEVRLLPTAPQASWQAQSPAAQGADRAAGREAVSSQLSW